MSATRRPWLAWLALLSLTAVAAALRFYKLDVPTLWGDEVATWGRVTGTFAQLMDRLSREGFVPGHYVLYWLLGKYAPLDPWHMRLIPAVAGVLIVPAGYFLARQMFARPTALVAALLLTTSAFGMTYARDAKMYMHTWLFVTLSGACLMHWLRTRRPWSFWGWILAGAIASTFHATSLILLAIAPLLALTRWALVRRPRWRDPLYLAVGAALIGAFPAWYYFSFNQYIARTGIAPAPTVADERIDAEDVAWRNSGITWVQQFNEGIGAWELSLNSATSYLVGLQWPREAIDPRGFRKDAIPPWFLPACVAIMTPLLLLLTLGALPWRRGHDVTHAVHDGRMGWVVSAVWLGLWIVISTYGVFYCRSFATFVPPWEPLTVAHAAIDGRWHILVPLAIAAAGLLGLWPGAAGWLAAALAMWWAATMGLAMARAGSYWLHEWGRLLDDPRLLWPMAALTPAVAWHYAGANFRGRAVKAGQLLAGAAIVFGACVGAYFFWRYMLVLHERKNPGVPWESIWMPRYLGIIYPALMVAAAGLLMRLPTWPLRTAAIAGLVAVNLAQGLARIELDTEPPLHQVAADLWATRTTARATAVGIEREDDPEGYRRDWTRGWIMEYYLYSVSGWDDAPEMKRSIDPRRVVHYRVDIVPDQVRRGLDRRPELNRIILWEKFEALSDPPQADPLLDELGDRLERTGERVYRTHQFWTWRPGDVYRRREYVRKAP